MEMDATKVLQNTSIKNTGSTKQKGLGCSRKRRNQRKRNRKLAEQEELNGAFVCDPKLYAYLIIGSQDSTDIDTLYVVDRLPSTQLCYQFCDTDVGPTSAESIDVQHDERGAATPSHLARLRRHKVENRNMIVLDEEGVVCDCFKGITDAIHNCVYYTYSLHDQDHPSPLANRLVHRNVPMRLVKAIRDLIGIIAKTKYRDVAKASLKDGDSFNARIECLKGVDFREVHAELDASKLKTVAFHLAQLIGLMRGREYFTKSDLAAAFPELSPLLKREDASTAHLEALNTYRSLFVDMIRAGANFQTKGHLLLFSANPQLCQDRWNMLNYSSRGMIIDYVREQCLAYPLDHSFTLPSAPAWPTDECLLRNEKLDRLVRPEGDDGSKRVEFFAAYVEPGTDRMRIAGERSFDVPPAVAERWNHIVESQEPPSEERTHGEKESTLRMAMKKYTLIFVRRTDGEERALELFGLRRRHTWELQPKEIVQDLAAQLALPFAEMTLE